MTWHHQMQLNFQFAFHIYTDIVLIYLEVNTGKQLLIADASVYSGVHVLEVIVFVFGKHRISFRHSRIIFCFIKICYWQFMSSIIPFPIRSEISEHLSWLSWSFKPFFIFFCHQYKSLWLKLFRYLIHSFRVPHKKHNLGTTMASGRGSKLLFVITNKVSPRVGRDSLRHYQETVSCNLPYPLQSNTAEG